MNRATVVSLGSINADFQVRVDEPPGSRETLLAHDFRRFAGGKASNTAYLAARFGHRSLLAGCVGDDGLAEQTFGPLREAGVSLDGVCEVAGQATGVSMILVPPDGKKHIILSTNANDQWSDDAIDVLCRTLEAVELPGALVLNYEVPAHVVRQAVERATARDLTVIVDPSFPDRVEVSLMDSFDVMTPNQHEAAVLAGMPIETPDDAGRAAKALRDKGAAIACVKLGDGGCVLATAEGITHLPPNAVEVVDSTGAGDAFTGLFTVALVEGHSPLEAAAWGVAAANEAVTHYGSQPAYPDRQTLLEGVKRILPRAQVLNV